MSVNIQYGSMTEAMKQWARLVVCKQLRIIMSCRAKSNRHVRTTYSRTSLSGQSEKRIHPLDLERTKFQSRTVNPTLVNISNVREATTSKLRTADTILGPKALCHVFLPPNSGHSGNHTLIIAATSTCNAIQPLPHVTYVPCARVQIFTNPNKTITACRPGQLQSTEIKLVQMSSENQQI